MPPRLSFSFSKRNRVLLSESEEIVSLICTEQCTPEVALEVQRVFLPVYGNKLSGLKVVSDTEFDQELNQLHENEQAEDSMMAINSDESLSGLMETMPENIDLLESENDAPVIRLVNAIFTQAIQMKASDIHIEPYETDMAIRIRVDGVMHEIFRAQQTLSNLVTSRIKVLSKLDIAEKRVPQDGRVSLKVAGRAIDLRVSTMPNNFGERVVMRILDKGATRIGLAELGMEEEQLQLFSKLLKSRHGIILVTGPTGSGKTTSLYSGLSMLNDGKHTILTVEDPIEYSIAGIGQTQVNHKIDMTFARALKAILRQDPDVIMVGEIRDQETAEIAVQASLTGHLVLSTLHTNSAVGAITRLKDMGLEPFLIASSLKGVVAQRLVRKLCHCAEPSKITDAEAKRLGQELLAGRKCFREKGCAECNQTGFKGRVAIFEILEVDEHMGRLINNDDSELDMLKYLRGKMPFMVNQSWRMIRDGKTTPTEVLRVIQDADL